MYQKNKPAILLLSDGTIFHGNAVGKIGETIGEICFNTGMTGYFEILTDPSYFGQLILFTHTHIGNYGVQKSEFESAKIRAAGFICPSFSNVFSRENSTSLQSNLETENCVGIDGLDTRALVRHIRKAGAMNAIISSECFDLDILKEKLSKAIDMSGCELASQVTTSEPYFLGNPTSNFKVAVLDYGCKQNILNQLVNRGCYLKVFPAKSTFEEIMEFNPTGVFLSNGPGDPAAMPYTIPVIQQFLTINKPIFGICLGHQLLCIANGIDTYKMKYGHRGINHPIQNLVSGKCEITSQNHGFSVIKEQITTDSLVSVTHINLNDHTVEGIQVKNKNAFSVQYHPESNPGPHDSRYLFDQFVNNMQLN